MPTYEIHNRLQGLIILLITITLTYVSMYIPLEQYYAEKQSRTWASNTVRIYNDIKTNKAKQDDSFTEMTVKMLSYNDREKEYGIDFEKFTKNRLVVNLSFYSESIQDTCPGLAISERETDNKSRDQSMLYIILVSPYCRLMWNEVPSAIYYSDDVSELVTFMPINDLGLGWVRNCLFASSKGCNRFSEIAKELENDYTNIYTSDLKSRLSARRHFGVSSIILHSWMEEYSKSKIGYYASVNPIVWDKMANVVLDSLHDSKPSSSISIFGLTLAVDFLPLIISLVCAYIVTNIAHLARVLLNDGATEPKIGLLLYPEGWYERLTAFLLALAPPFFVLLSILITIDLVKPAFNIFCWSFYLNPLTTEFHLSGSGSQNEALVDVGNSTINILFFVYLYAIVVSYQASVRLGAVRRMNMMR